jgi:hypothetical protein
MILRLTTLVAVLLLGMTVDAPAAPPNLIVNSGFERGERGWKSSWGDGQVQVACDATRAHSGQGYAVLSADNANAGIDGIPLHVDADLSVNVPYVVTAWTANLGIERGQFGLRVYAYDADGKMLAMKSFGSLGPGSAKTDWQQIKARIGPGTDFPFPDNLDRLVVRFSIWDSTGLCKARVLLDDVTFAPLQSDPTAEIRRFERSPKGTIAIWSDEIPGIDPASDPAYLATQLRQAGYAAHLITTDELADRAILSDAQFDLLILPYPEVYPASGAETLRRFLRSGTHLITLGGPCFQKPLWPANGTWSAKLSRVAITEPPHPVVEPSEGLAVKLTEELSATDQPARVSLSRAPDKNPALRVEVDDLQFYIYLRFPTRSTARHNVLQFRAIGDDDTKHLCIECNEADGSRWKAAMELSPQWQTYEVSTGDFVSYASDKRGQKGDYLQADKVRRIAFGFPRSMVGTGKHSFEISAVNWLASDVDPGQIDRSALLVSDSSVLIRAFGQDLKNANRGGDITAFLGTQAFGNVTGLEAAPQQRVFPPNFSLDGRFSGMTATLPDTNAYQVPEKQKTSRGLFLPTRKTARLAPLLLTPDGRPAASLAYHLDGPYTGGVWALFGVTNRDLFPAGNESMGKAFVALVDRMLAGASIAELEPRFVADADGAGMEVVAKVANHGLNSQKLKLRTSLRSGDQADELPQQESPVELCAGTSREVVVLRANAGQFDWKDYSVTCSLDADGRTVDTMETSVDVRRTFVAICDRFLQQQQARGDGKIHGYGFVDNRGIRALLAAYELFDRPEYLEGAIRWGGATLADQREDGGYLMGYGNYPVGDECFVADGGEIACGIGRLIAYVPEKDRQRYVDSLNAYMAYRESFRCEGGGIGVGWCKSDYGSRPIKRLDTITKIYAPENNIYTIGCTLTAAIMHARLTGDPNDNTAAVRDAYWWMDRCKSTTGGAFVESAAWAHAYLPDYEVHQATEQFLRDKFVPHVTKPSNRWWTTGAGRTVQGLDGLAYYYDRIEKDPKVLATLMRATYHVCSPQALSSVPRILAKHGPTRDDWLYLNFAAVSLPDLLESEIIRKDVWGTP